MPLEPYDQIRRKRPLLVPRSVVIGVDSLIYRGLVAKLRSRNVIIGVRKRT